MNKKLYRSRNNQIISGVCAGIGEYLNIDPTIIRILFLFALIGWGSGIFIYIICLLVIPLEPSGYNSYAYTINEKHNSFFNNNGRIILGIILIIFGIGSILEKIFHWFDFDLILPIAIIGIGFIILTRDK
ncbi:MAG: PspC domain-containing protein [Vallitalea sp.]|jgi:phage shock protein C|nr:PspC domain-containing protein [Vallitalea sp.]